MDENIVPRRLVETFAEVVSDINVSKYNEAEYRRIIGAIYWDIFIKEDENDD